MREKLATRVKRVREKKTKKGKESIFIDCHLLLQGLLHSKHVPLSLLLQDLQEMKNKMEEDEEELT